MHHFFSLLYFPKKKSVQYYRTQILTYSRLLPHNSFIHAHTGKLECNFCSADNIGKHFLQLSSININPNISLLPLVLLSILSDFVNSLPYSVIDIQCLQFPFLDFMESRQMCFCIAASKSFLLSGISSALRYFSLGLLQHQRHHSTWGAVIFSTLLPGNNIRHRLTKEFVKVVVVHTGQNHPAAAKKKPGRSTAVPGVTGSPATTRC